MVYGLGKHKKRWRKLAPDSYGKYIMWRRNFAIHSKRTISGEEMKLRNIVKKIFKHHTLRYNDRYHLKGLELDIFIPELRLAIEYNGKGHNNKNDTLKKNLCFHKGIRLLIIKEANNLLRTRKLINNFLIEHNISHFLHNTKSESVISPTLL